MVVPPVLIVLVESKMSLNEVGLTLELKMDELLPKERNATELLGMAWRCLHNPTFDIVLNMPKVLSVKPLH